MTTRILGAGVRGAMILAATGMILTAGATPVAVDWKATETAPVKVARPFAGFLADGSFTLPPGATGRILLVELIVQRPEHLHDSPWRIAPVRAEQAVLYVVAERSGQEAVDVTMAYGNKSLYLTDEGAARAKEILEKYGIADWEK